MKNRILLLGIFIIHNVIVLWGQNVPATKNNFVNVLSVTPNGLTIEIDINDFDRNAELIDEKEYYKISLKRESFIHEKGYPELPKIVRDISIPPTSGITGKTLKSEYKDIQLPVIPSKGILLRKINPKDVPYTFGEVYSKNEFYPENRFDFGEPYLMRNTRGNTVSIYPFAYNPVTQTLRIYTKLTIEISFEGANNKNALARISEEKNQYFEPIFRNHFINYDAQSNANSAGNTRNGITDNGKMLIITHDSFYNDILGYATHKNNTGIPTQVVKMSNIGTTSTQIHNYIKNSYNNDNTLTFVLLAGDHAQVPSMLVNSAGSDPSYSLIVGNDNYPDIIVGRFSAETNAHLATMISRSIAYDNMTEQSWFHKGIGIASAEGPGHNNEYDYQHARNIRTKLLNYHYTGVDELYEGSQGGQDVSGNPFAAMVSAAVNNGASIISYTGHGDYDRWVTSNFTNSNVSALTNNNKLPFVFSVACQNGNFTGYTCFAETWLRSNNSTGNPIGAVAFYGSSVNQAWTPPMYAQDDFISLLTSNSNTTFGALCYNACLGMISSFGIQEFRHWHIFGDPSLTVIPHRQCLPVNLTNETITVNRTVTSCSDIHVQNVTVRNNVKLILDAANETTISKDFEVVLGSELEIK
ncbi:MAG: C25 family cysteine peptidase [Prevotellaceae bacterium]|nr:C25 family cysteine peptidase [Prevotellaceae bacterium]